MFFLVATVDVPANSNGKRTDFLIVSGPGFTLDAGISIERVSVQLTRSVSAGLGAKSDNINIFQNGPEGV
jgi:hypothetical protein